MSALVTCSYDAAVTYCYDPAEGARLDPALRLTRMHEQFRDYIGRVLKGLARGRLSIRDLEDVYEDTLRALLESLRQPGFGPRNPRAFFEAIARHKAQNALRRLGHQPNTNADDVLNGIDAERTGSPLGRARHCNPAEMAAFRVKLMSRVQALPERQWLVAQLYIQRYEALGKPDSFQNLAALLSEITGRPENPGTVKSLWYSARATLAELLGPDYAELCEGLR